MRNHPPCKGIDECRKCALFRDRVQLRSGLVDLVVSVGHNLCGGHRLTLAGQRFVGLVAEDMAEMSDRGIEFKVHAVARGLTTAIRTDAESTGGVSHRPRLQAAWIKHSGRWQ